MSNNLIYLHTDLSGDVWHKVNGFMPVRTGLTSNNLHKYRTRPSDVVKLLGTKANTSLILDLYDKKQRNKLSNVYVAAPDVLNCKAYESANKTAALITNLDMINGLATSLGGWHEFTELDYPSYVFCKTRTKRPIHLLKRHPAWPALSFVPINHTSLADLISELLDPRWFVDRSSPNNIGKLLSYLGLTAQRNPHNELSTLVSSIWMNEESTDNTNNVFMRLYQKIRPNWLGKLKTSIRFISYLRAVWLSSIYRHNSVLTDESGLFDPVEFFKNEAEIEAYNRHLKISTST